MTEFKETELDERAIKMAKSCRPTRLSVRDTATRVPPSPWRLSPTLCTSISSSMIRTIPIGKVATASSFLAVMLPSPSTSSCTSPATA